MLKTRTFKSMKQHYLGSNQTDFLAGHHSLKIKAEQSVELGIYGSEKEPWILKFDGSSIENLAGAGIVIISLGGSKDYTVFQSGI